MALQIQTFPSIDAAKYAAFAAKIKADTGTELSGDSGIVTHGSFTFTYAYNVETQVLTIQCLKKPLFIPASTIIKGIADEISELPSA